MIAAVAADRNTRPLINIEHHANGLPYLRIAVHSCAQCYGTGSEEFRGVDSYPCDLCEGKGTNFILVGRAAEDYADRCISRQQFSETDEAAVNAALALIAQAEYAARPFVCACGFRQQMPGDCIVCGAPVGKAA